MSLDYEFYMYYIYGEMSSRHFEMWLALQI